RDFLGDNFNCFNGIPGKIIDMTVGAELKCLMQQARLVFAGHSLAEDLYALYSCIICVFRIDQQAYFWILLNGSEFLSSGRQDIDIQVMSKEVCNRAGARHFIETGAQGSVSPGLEEIPYMLPEL